MTPAAAALLFATLAGASPAARLDVAVEGLRSTRGDIQLCLTTQPDHFPDCQDDPAARRMTVAATRGATLSFDDLPSGAYAIALIHDENGNRRLDTTFGIPREGFGFSRNPVIGFSPPRFAAARFAVSGAEVSERVKVKYLL